MEENEKKIALGIVIFLLLCIIVFFAGRMFFFRKAPEKRVSIGRPESMSVKNIKSGTKEPDRKYSRSSFTSSSIPAGQVGSPFSKAELEEMNEREKKAELEVLAAQKRWIDKKVNDETLSEKTREKYRLRSISTYVSGLSAYKAKDYRKAVKDLFDSMKDPKASDVSRYMALMYIRSAALEMGDFELFLEATRAQAVLAAEKDLAVLGITRSDSGIKFVEKLEMIYKMKKDPSEFNRRVEEIMSKNNVREEYRKRVEDALKKEIEEYDEIYGDYFKRF